MVALAAIFAAIALVVLAVGLSTPKKYVSTSTIRVQEESIIDPLMKGRSAPSTPTDHAGIAREIALSRDVLDRAIVAGGWDTEGMSPVDQDRLRQAIASRTSIYNPHQNTTLIKIGYADSDPDRARQVAQSITDSVINANLKEQASDSRTAFEFIDQQTVEYERNLVESESALAAYYRAHPEVAPGNEADSARRIGDLLREQDRARMDAIDQRAEASALRSHLASEGSLGASGARSSQIQQQLTAAQSELDGLLGKYTERHPDVVRTRHQIESLQAELRRERANPTRSVGVAVGDQAAQSGARARLADARSRSQASAQRLAIAEQLIAEERERNGKLIEMEGELAQLKRDYDTSLALYEDMVDRRETARISMNLDAQHGDLSFRIQEPAEVPLQASGMRVMYVALAGLALAAAVPILLVFGVLKLDPRVRSPSQIEYSAGLPVLGAVPMSQAGARRAETRKQVMMAAALVAAVPVIYLFAMILRQG